ncbi:MAG: hypothetical protein V3V84_07620 [Candidatus Bathyarchaeia archaeon]
MSNGFFPTTQGFQDAGAGGGGGFDPSLDQTITGEWKFDVVAGESFYVGFPGGGFPVATTFSIQDHDAAFDATSSSMQSLVFSSVGSSAVIRDSIAQDDGSAFYQVVANASTFFIGGVSTLGITGTFFDTPRFFVSDNPAGSNTQFDIDTTSFTVSIGNPVNTVSTTITADTITSAGIAVTQGLKTGTLASPPTGMVIGEDWWDTTGSAVHPVKRTSTVVT